jgi:hypothetical protein
MTRQFFGKRYGTGQRTLDARFVDQYTLPGGARLNLLANWSEGT